MEKSIIEEINTIKSELSSEDIETLISYLKEERIQKSSDSASNKYQIIKKIKDSINTFKIRKGRRKGTITFVRISIPDQNICKFVENRRMETLIQMPWCIGIKHFAPVDMRMCDAAYVFPVITFENMTGITLRVEDHFSLEGEEYIYCGNNKAIKAYPLPKPESSPGIALERYLTNLKFRIYKERGKKDGK